MTKPQTQTSDRAVNAAGDFFPEGAPKKSQNKAKFLDSSVEFMG